MTDVGRHHDNVLALESLVRCLRCIVSTCVLEATIVLEMEALAAGRLGTRASHISVREIFIYSDRSHVRASEHALFLSIAASVVRAFKAIPVLLNSMAKRKGRDFNVVDVAVTGSRHALLIGFLRSRIGLAFLTIANPGAVRLTSIPIAAVPALISVAQDVLRVFRRRRAVRFDCRETIGANFRIATARAFGSRRLRNSTRHRIYRRTRQS